MFRPRHWTRAYEVVTGQFTKITGQSRSSFSRCLWRVITPPTVWAILTDASTGCDGKSSRFFIRGVRCRHRNMRCRVPYCHRGCDNCFRELSRMDILPLDCAQPFENGMLLLLPQNGLRYRAYGINHIGTASTCGAVPGVKGPRCLELNTFPGMIPAIVHEELSSDSAVVAAAKRLTVRHGSVDDSEIGSHW